MSLRIAWTLRVLTILIVFHMNCVFFTLHALEVVTFPLKLIIFLLGLWLIRILRSLLLPIVTSSHIGVLHVLNTSIWHEILLRPWCIGPWLVCILLHSLLLLGHIILFTRHTHLFPISSIDKLAHAAVTVFHLFGVVFRSTLGFDCRGASLTYWTWVRGRALIARGGAAVGAGWLERALALRVLAGVRVSG